MKNQSKIDAIVNKWTKKNTLKYLGNILSKNSVPWGKVKTFSQFLNTKTADNNLMKAKINNNNIIVPECAIRVPNNKPSTKKVIPKVGQNNEEILKGLGYSKKVISELRKKNILD